MRTSCCKADWGFDFLAQGGKNEKKDTQGRSHYDEKVSSPALAS